MISSSPFIRKRERNTNTSSTTPSLKQPLPICDENTNTDNYDSRNKTKSNNRLSSTSPTFILKILSLSAITLALMLLLAHLLRQKQNSSPFLRSDNMTADTTQHHLNAKKDKESNGNSDDGSTVKFCGSNEWKKSHISCEKRAQFLVSTYQMSEQNAKSSLLGSGHCQCNAQQQQESKGGVMDKGATTTTTTTTSDSVAMMKANTQRLGLDTAETTPASFTVDILSVGSINQLDLLHAQLNTIATHTSVRNFFNATELDDADPNCHTDITVEHVKKVSKYCRSRSQWIGPIFRILRNNYGRYEWLQKKKNPTGWLCAQVRPYSGLMKAQLHYKRTGQELPDYFLIFDDDTYYNMELFQQNFASVNSLEERVYSGCLVRLPIHTTNLTFPFGGFGSILSKGALMKLFGRNQCPGLDDTANVNNINSKNTEELSTKDSSSAFCGRLKENNAGELKYFTNGMSLVELMYKYTSTDKYRDVNEWWASGSGFCMHSDWVLGYFVNYYNVSKHVADPFYRDVPHARLESYKESEIYRKSTGFCRNDPKCDSNTEICHRATPEWMETETKRWKLMVPDKFV